MSTFTEARHPRGTGGRFVPVPKTEPDLVLSAGADLRPARLAAARFVLEEYADLELADHSPARRDFVRLDELGDPGLALGNCWAATNELIENVPPSGFAADRVDEVTLNRRLGGRHVALLAGNGHDTWVVDYTARQFNPALPFPFVAGVAEWKATVEAASGQHWDFDTETEED